MTSELKDIIESLIFVAQEPVSPEKLRPSSEISRRRTSTVP